MSYIGLDVGGTNVRYTFIDELNSEDVRLQKKAFTKMGDPYSEVEENICKIIDMGSENIEGVGISLAAILDRSTGKVKMWPNNPCWNNYELIKHLHNRYSVPIIVEDDANCGAIGEYHFLALPVKNMAYITIGTGIGCGFILNSTLYIGENGFAGELGHIWIDKDNHRLCSCGNKGCFQSMVSGPVVLNEYNMATDASLEFFEQVYARYIQNDSIAAVCFSNMIDNISIVIYNLAICLDISLFIIGGGVSNIGVEFISKIENKVNNRLKTFKRKISVIQAQLGEFSGVYGALHLLKAQSGYERK